MAKAPKPKTPTAKPAAGPPKKWKIVENLCAAVEQIRATVPGTRITPRAQIPSTKHPDEEPIDLDVLVEFPASGRPFRLGVDVKDEARKLSTNMARELIAKQEELGLNMYYVVSTSGFDRPAERRLREKGIHPVVLEKFDSSEFFAPNGGTTQVIRASGNLTFFALAYDGDVPAGIELPAQEIVVTDVDGNSTTLFALICSAAKQRAEEEQSVTEDWHGAIPLKLDVSNMRLSRMDGTVIPSPKLVAAVVDYRNSVTPVKEHRYRIWGIEMCTSVIEHEGELRQHTIFVMRNAEGQQQIGAVIGPANPQKVLVPHPT